MVSRGLCLTSLTLRIIDTIMANLTSYWDFRASSHDQIPLNYACAKDDERFMRAYTENTETQYGGRRIQWVYQALACAVGNSNLIQDLFSEMLEGSGQDLWLWVDGDEAALLDFKPEYRYGAPQTPAQIPRRDYELAFNALQRRKQMTLRFGSRKMADIRQMVQAETPLVRLAAIMWLIFTSEAVTRHRGRWPGIDKEEWYSVNLIKDWWRTLWTAHYALPFTEAVSEFEKMMDERGHSCSRWYGLRNGLAVWLHVRSVLYPELDMPEDLIDFMLGSNIFCCEGCQETWFLRWEVELETSVVSEGGLTKLIGNKIRTLVTSYASLQLQFLRSLAIIISMRDPRNSLVIVPAKFTIGRPEGDTDSESQEAILVVTIGVDGGEIIGLVPCTSGTITDTKTLRNALKSEHCIDVMQQLSMPWVLGVMELLHFEIKIRSPNHKLCNHYLRRLSKIHGMLPPSFLIYNVEQDGKFPVKTGGFADVYKGRLNEQAVCLKVLRYFSSCTAADRQKLIKDFCREALVWKQLDHPNILPALGVASDLFYPSVCLVSPWMHNGNINDFLETNPGHDRHKAITEIADAINYLHSYDPPIVHADIRGANVLVTRDHRCCLADFGLAAVVESQAFTSTSRRSQGTLRWMAPEYFQDSAPQTTQPPRDIYAFSCTVLEIFTGKPPFHYFRQEGAVLNQVLNGKHPRRDDFPSDRGMYHDKLWSLLESCWHQDPAGRPTALVILDYLYILEQF